MIFESQIYAISKCSALAAVASRKVKRKKNGPDLQREDKKRCMAKESQEKIYRLCG